MVLAAHLKIKKIRFLECSENLYSLNALDNFNTLNSVKLEILQLVFIVVLLI